MSDGQQTQWPIPVLRGHDRQADRLKVAVSENAGRHEVVLIPPPGGGCVIDRAGSEQLADAMTEALRVAWLKNAERHH